MKRKTNSIIMLICIIAIFVFTSCSGGSYKIIKGDIDVDSNKMSGEYSEFNGDYYKKVKLKEGEIIKFDISINTDKGEFSAKFIDSDNKKVVDLEKSKSVKINKTDTYKIKVYGKEHKGKFTITWSKK